MSIEINKEIFRQVLEDNNTQDIDTQEPVQEDADETQAQMVGGEETLHHTIGQPPYQQNTFSTNQMLPNDQTVTIVRMVIIRSGTYNPIIRHPYTIETTPENIDKLGSVLEETRLRPQSSNLSSIPGIVKPDMWTMEPVNIPNGWNAPRYRFLLEVDIDQFGTKRKHIYQGYSEYADESISGHIDPRVVWHINSVTVISSSNPYGSVSEASVVTGNANILRQEIDNINIDHMHYYSLRPKDVFTGENAYLNVPGILSGDNLTNVDTVVNLSAMVQNKPQPSNRSNNIPGRYLSEIIRAYETSKSLASIGSDIVDTFNAAAGTVGEYMVQNDGFLRLLGTIHSNRYGVQKLVESVFTFEDLTRYDPMFSNKIQYIRRGQAVRQQDPIYMEHQTGMTEDWSKLNLESEIATILVDTIPAIMTECLLSRIQFSVAIGVDGRPVFTPSHANSLFNIPLDVFTSNFERKFLYEIYPQITRGGLLNVNLVVNAFLYGDIWVTVSVDGKPEAMFNAPSFTDSLYVPVLTNKEETYQNIVYGFNEVFNLIDNLEN